MFCRHVEFYEAGPEAEVTILYLLPPPERVQKPKAKLSYLQPNFHLSGRFVEDRLGGLAEDIAST